MACKFHENSPVSLNISPLDMSYWRNDLFKAKTLSYEPRTGETSIQCISAEVLRIILLYCVSQNDPLRLRLISKQWNAQISVVLNLRLTIIRRSVSSISCVYSLINNTKPVENSAFKRNWIDFEAFCSSGLLNMVKDVVMDGNISNINFSVSEPISVDRLTIESCSIRVLNGLLSHRPLFNFIEFKKLIVRTTVLNFTEMRTLEQMVSNGVNGIEIHVGSAVTFRT